MTDRITGAAFCAMVINAAAAIETNKVEINELNVFPVPDGDTGTNMSLTLGAGAKALGGAAPGTVGRAAELTASSLLRGARGNSGVILSLLFRGIAKRLKDADFADAAAFAGALADGVDSAYKAVMKPTEGTILTVSRLAAAAAVQQAELESDVEIVLQRAIEAGRIALEDTINQNPVLKKAGVIDAGGKGYLYILDGMLKALRGELITAAQPAAPARARANFSDFDTGDIQFVYCTELIVDRKTKRDALRLRDFLDMRGDSIVVVDDEAIIKVHVHTNEPGAVITEALTYGALLEVKIENMREQHTEQVVSSGKPAPAAPEKRYGAVAVAAGEGMAEVLRDVGVDHVITGGQTMNPSTEDILTMVEATPSEVVFVLPNNKNIIMAAQQCVPLSDKEIVVIPTRSIPQGISAMLAFEPAGELRENTENMEAAARRVRTVHITQAARDSEFDGRAIREGEYLALLDDALAASSRELCGVVDAVARTLGGIQPEFITVFSGEDAPDAEADGVLSAIRQAAPGAEAEIVRGGQPVYHYIISAE